jgi:hypothetical protein
MKRGEERGLFGRKKSTQKEAHQKANEIKGNQFSVNIEKKVPLQGGTMWGKGGCWDEKVWRCRKRCTERCRGVIKTCRGGQKVHRGWHAVGKRSGVE